MAANMIVEVARKEKVLQSARSHEDRYMQQ